MHAQETLDKLMYVKAGRFPRQALEEAVACRQEITPHLLDVLRDTRERYHDFLDEPDYFGHIFAMFLLAQFRERRAYPLIADLFSLPGEDPYDMVGDFLNEDLPRVLASVAGSDTSRMTRIIEDEALEQSTRNSAISAIVSLVACGKLDREDAVGYFKELFRGKLVREGTYVWAGLVCACLDLYPEELLVEVRQAFADHLVDPMTVTWEDVERTLALGKEKTLYRLEHNRHYALVEDVVRETEWWACFKKPQASPSAKKPAKTKVGRNQPCPCGSGKKYKKCCGSRAANV